MGTPWTTLAVCSVLFLSSVYCDHDHHSHHNNAIWHMILSSLGIDWENRTQVALTTESISAAVTSKTDYYNEEYRTSDSPSDYDSESSTFVLQHGGDFSNDARTAFKASLALLIGVPIALIVVVITCCYFICKCCCGSCRRDENIIVMQNTALPAVAPQPAQVVINHHIPSPYEMNPNSGWNPQQQPQQQQWNPHQPPQQQWNHLQQQPQYPPQYAPNAYSNPTYSPPFNPDYSSPPKY